MDDAWGYGFVDGNATNVGESAWSSSSSSRRSGGGRYHGGLGVSQAGVAGALAALAALAARSRTNDIVVFGRISEMCRLQAATDSRSC